MATLGRSEEQWQPARLIPVVGIRSTEEQEKRATSALLAVMRAVPEFGHALVTPLGAPKGRLSTYTEIQLKDSAGKTHIPDGAIVAERGKTTWRCLVEVKTEHRAATSRSGRALLGHGARARLRRRADDLQPDHDPPSTTARSRLTSASCGTSASTTSRGGGY